MIGKIKVETMIEIKKKSNCKRNSMNISRIKPTLRCPSGIFEDISQDWMRHQTIVITHADIGAPNLILLCHSANSVYQFVFICLGRIKIKVRINIYVYFFRSRRWSIVITRGDFVMPNK